MVKKVRNDVVLKIKKLLYNMGYIIERSANEDQLFIELHTPHDTIQRSKLKARASKDRFYNNHRHYNNLLKRFVPDWDITFKSAEFVGYGIGKYNFGVYRKVYFDDKYYFEKVYFNNSFALKKNEWIYNNGYSILSNYLNTPKLCKIIKGDLISIVYFDFIDFVPLPEDERLSVMLSFSREMFSINKDFEPLS